ncbi:hypothetical protein ACFL1X_01540 [Candidatus Hydrogenedentota bacterium]
MATSLDKFLDTITPERTLDDVGRSVDEGFNSFRMKSDMVTKWDEFEDILARFHCHLLNFILGLNPPHEVNHYMDWGLVSHLLVEEYGPEGRKTAFEIARTGKEDGMNGILKAVARRMIKKYAGNEISARVAEYLEDMTVDEQFAVQDEYFEKCGHLLPSEMVEEGAVRLRVRFDKTLARHPEMLQRLRQTRR